VILTESQAYGRQKARPGPLATAKGALKALAADATYLTNLRLIADPEWRQKGQLRSAVVSHGWGGFTESTFQACLIGFDDRTAFIIFAEEED
jgi:hypothetical protein